MITFFISIVVIVYGSFKSLNLDKKFNECQGDGNSYTGKGESQKLFSQNGDINQTDDQNANEMDDDDDDDDENGLFSKHSCDRDGVDSVQTIDSVQALFIPVVASLSLLFMFFFFDSIQTVFVICTSSNLFYLFASLFLRIFYFMNEIFYCSKFWQLRHFTIY